jgi:replicative DNA helicase
MAPVIIDNLQKYGIDFQIKIIVGILSDKSFFERVLDMIEVDAFENESHRWIVNESIHYYNQYREMPSLQVFKVRIDTIQSPDFKTSVIEHIKPIFNKIKDGDKDLQFVKEQFLEFCKNQKLKSAIVESVDYLKSGNYEKIKFLVDKAMKAGMERNLGHDYNIDIASRMNETCRKVVPTGWEVVDSLMDGGLGPGELGVVVAPAGVGKSWLLCSLGAKAMLAGKNVAHFTLELNENYVGLRYDCCFTGINFQQIKYHQPEVEKILKSVKGRLFVKYFPLKTVSAQSLKFHVERIQTLNNFKIDEIIVDYADILRPLEKEKNSNSYSEGGSIYEELRQVAGELQVPIWTASQANRTALGEDIVQAHNVSDSYRKIMTADFVMSLSRNIDDKANNTARFHVIKNRFGPDGITLYSNMDTGTGTIQIFDGKSKESIAIQSNMQEDSNSVKNLLKNKWNSHRQNEKGNDSNL